MEIVSAVEQAARDSYCRLLAFLAARSRDVAAAEDALSEAFLAALKTWPETGVPRNPEAWLLIAARRRLIDSARHMRVHLDALPSLLAAADEAQNYTEIDMTFPDERLKLLFICAHPAIDAASRTPLMLQTVMGLDAARIASAFLVSPAAMGQRLTRAKAKIRVARIAFAVPEPKELPARLQVVLEAIYAAYGSGWEDASGSDPRRRRLASEAIKLGRLLLQLLPDEPEAKGLAALMLYCESRRNARCTDDRGYVPLSEQDCARWSRPMIKEAEELLFAASRAERMGRFQLEAAIQSAHARRASTGVTDWETIALLYEGLVRIAPSIGALVGRAAAFAEARDAEQGLALLASIPAERVSSYQPYWALTAHLLSRMQRKAEAAEAYERAIGLCEDAATREFLQRKLS